MQVVDYRMLPIANAAAKTSFADEEIEKDDLLKGILLGSMSLEDRLEGIPKFSFSFETKTSQYHGASLEKLKSALKDRKIEKETRVKRGIASLAFESVKGFFSLFYDRSIEFITSEEASLEENRDRALEELKKLRESERASKIDLERASSSLRDYVNNLEIRYRQDQTTFPKLGKFTYRLQNEIDDLKSSMDDGDFNGSEFGAYQEQVWRGQEYFNRLVNQLGYLKREMDLIGNSKEKYGQMLLKLGSLIDNKESKLRESLVKIKEAEMTRDLSVIVEAADCLLELDADAKELDSLNNEINDIIQAAFDAVDRSLESDSYSPLTGEFRESVYSSKVSELSSLMGGYAIA